MGLMDTLKSAGDLALKYQQMELYEQIMGLREEIQSLRESKLSITEDRDRLSRELQELKQLSAQEKELVHFENSYYLVSDTARRRPFCATCWDHDRKLISKICLEGYHPRCDICVARKTRH